ncbi:MAG: Fic family protein [Pelistega sp.]|nr:Fic family protein [Pelistega sp.]
MAKYSDKPDSYTDPRTGVLRNKLNHTNDSKLEEDEKFFFLVRSYELDINPINGNFDLSHLQRIHEKLFSDVYDWAGQIRKVDISKGNTRFAHYNFIEKETNTLLSLLKKENHLKKLPLDKFCNRVAFYIGELNVLHPFRDGNGRALRRFFTQLANEVGYRISWDNITSEQMIYASIAAYNGSTEPLERLIYQNIKVKD